MSEYTITPATREAKAGRWSVLKTKLTGGRERGVEEGERVQEGGEEEGMRKRRKDRGGKKREI